MSINPGGVDARAYLAGWLAAVTQMTIADINAIPEDKWVASMGGCARAANGLLADIICNLQWTTGAVSGQQSDAYNHMDAIAAECADKSVAVAKLSEASAALGAAIKAASDEILNSSVMAPWQMETPVMILAHIAVAHVWYHDGQFNFIHSLLGDEKVYWMGG